LSLSRSAIIGSLLFGAVVFLVIAFGAANFRRPQGPRQAPFAGDFIQEYVGGYIVLHGDHSRFYELAYAQQLEHDPDVAGFVWEPGPWFPMIYPPFYYLLVSPLHLLPIHTAALIWLALMIASSVGTVLLLAAHYPARTILPWALLGGLLFPPLFEGLTMCQKSPLHLLLFTATFVLLDRRQSFWAGVVFALTSFKPQLSLVIGLALLCKRDWRFVAGSLVTTAVLVGLCFLVGPEVCKEYFRLGVRLLGGDYTEMPNYPLTQLHSWNGFFKLLLLPEQAASMLTWIARGLTIALLVRLLWGPLSPGQPVFALQYSGLVLATVLLSPHLFTYDLSLLLLPIALLVIQSTDPALSSSNHSRTLLRFAAVLYVAAAFSNRLAQYMRSDTEPHVAVQISVLVMFGLLIGLTWLAWRIDSSCSTALAPVK
jgi:hypothetical protein